MTFPTAATNFHSTLDTELIFNHQYTVINDIPQIPRHVIVTERDLGYRFYPHSHRYVGDLVQRLIRQSIAGLQAADTEYLRGVSIPGSVELSVANGADICVSAMSSIRPVADLQLTLSDGSTITLTSNVHLKVTEAAPATVSLSTGMSAIQFAGMTATPADGAPLVLSEDQQAAAKGDTQITFSSPTKITLHDNGTATLMAGTVMILLDGEQLTLLKGTAVTFITSQPRPVMYSEIFSPGLYNPSTLVKLPYPVNDLDFTSGGAYSVYNWELFFHVPLMIAMCLHDNQRFPEALLWFHYIFDPTDDSDGSTPERFWKVRPFQTTDVKKIEEILTNLSTNADPALREETAISIEAWKNAPFRPHVIARYRQQAYMYKTVMAYLDNLIDWGDSLFRQDTGESIDEALMLYVMAANILGPRPQPVPAKGSVRPQTYANLRADLDKFGNAMRDMETDVPFDLMPFPTEAAANTAQMATLRGLGKTLYFCVPRNDKLLGYWDTVADRLFKIRNSLNFQGVFRQLALYAPPIDPALLVRATAAGLDIGAVVNGLYQPLGLVRFQLLVQKASELCQQVATLGNALVSAMEKEDEETLALLRSKHERTMLELVEHVKYAQLQEAIKSREGLLMTLALAVQRYTHFERQLGKQPDEIAKAIPDLGELDITNLTDMKFSMKEPEVALRDLAVDIAQDLGASGGRIMSSFDAEELEKSGRARDIQDAIKILRLAGQGMSLFPDFDMDLHFWGLGGTVGAVGGRKIAEVSRFAADVALALADRWSYESDRARKIGLIARRQEDWEYQSNLAAGEIPQIYKQIRAAQIREAIAEKELENHRQQMKQAEEIEQFLNEEGASRNGKSTNKAFKSWMRREVKGLYGQYFQFAFDIAKKAERALQQELGDSSLTYLQFGYLAGREGLLAGEKLQLDIKRMDMAYHDLNRREYELTKHVSILQLDPLALIQLRTTGACAVSLPESLFDMDGPGHYFRRIRNVAVSIPCVTGPYASINCTLTLLKSSIRVTPQIDTDYTRTDAEDTRFTDYFGSLQSIVTSSAQNDSGLFETNLHDERYLPFEGSGVISHWQLTLPANPSKGEPSQFDYDTISDVILHIRYTAREGGGLLRTGAMQHLMDLLKDTELDSQEKDAAKGVGLVRLFSVRHEFPTAWAKFQTPISDPNQRYTLTLNLLEIHYPFWAQGGRLKSVQRVDVLAESTESNLEIADKPNQADANPKKASLVNDLTYGNLLVGQLDGSLRPAQPIGQWTIYFDKNDIKDLWVAITWSAE